MTNREFLTAIAVDENAAVEIREYAQAQLDKMDAANEKRRNSVSKTEAANAPLREQIVNEYITTELQTASMIAEAMRANGIEITHNKVTAVLKKAVEEGLIAKEDVKVPKKGTQKGYKKAE